MYSILLPFSSFLRSVLQILFRKKKKHAQNIKRNKISMEIPWKWLPSFGDTGHFWLAWKIGVCNDQCWASRMAGWTGDCSTWQNILHCSFLEHYKCEKCQTLHYGTAHWLSWTGLYHFPWPWSHFKVTAVSDSFNWKFNVPIWLNWNFIGLFNTSSRSWTHHLFWQSHIFKGNNWHVSSFGKKLKHWLFLGHH